MFIFVFNFKFLFMSLQEFDELKSKSLTTFNDMVSSTDFNIKTEKAKELFTYLKVLTVDTYDDEIGRLMAYEGLRKDFDEYLENPTNPNAIYNIKVRLIFASSDSNRSIF